MTQLHAVIASSPGYAREDSPSPHLLGVYTDGALAQRVALWGHGVVRTLEVDAVPLGLVRTAQELGFALRVPAEEAPSDAGSLHGVLQMVPGYAREDAPTPSLVGLYRDGAVANQVRILSAFGSSAIVQSVVMDAVPAGLAALIAEASS